MTKIKPSQFLIFTNGGEQVNGKHWTELYSLQGLGGASYNVDREQDPEIEKLTGSDLRSFIPQSFRPLYNNGGGGNMASGSYSYTNGSGGTNTWNGGVERVQNHTWNGSLKVTENFVYEGDIELDVTHKIDVNQKVEICFDHRVEDPLTGVAGYVNEQGVYLVEGGDHLHNETMERVRDLGRDAAGDYWVGANQDNYGSWPQDLYPADAYDLVVTEKGAINQRDVLTDNSGVDYLDSGNFFLGNGQTAYAQFEQSEFDAFQQSIGGNDMSVWLRDLETNMIVSHGSNFSGDRLIGNSPYQDGPWADGVPEAVQALDDLQPVI